MKDLIVLVADKNAEFCMKGGLDRHHSLGIRPISYDIIVHPFRDGGTRSGGVELLKVERARYHHALMIFDFEGCGENVVSSGPLEDRLDDDLKAIWQGQAKCIIPDPEIDIWMWGSDNSMAEALGHSGLPFRHSLQESGFQFEANGKPLRPKEALESIFRKLGLPRSSAFYQKIARQLSIPRCQDPAFLRLKNQLQTWFPSGA